MLPSTKTCMKLATHSVFAPSFNPIGGAVPLSINLPLFAPHCGAFLLVDFIYWCSLSMVFFIDGVGPPIDLSARDDQKSSVCSAAKIHPAHSYQNTLPLPLVHALAAHWAKFPYHSICST